MLSFTKLIIASERDRDDSSLWMLPYSTLMLILLIFFAILFVDSYKQSIDYEMAIAELDDTNEGLKKEIILAKNMQKYINDNNMNDIAEIKVSARFIKLDLKSPALFESGLADLKPGILPLFRELADNLKNVDNTVVVEGHTDNIPIHNRFFDSNWELSSARAFSVLYFLINKEIDPERLIAHGFGEFRPIFSNDTADNRARNRRIEITIIRKGREA
ncbi:MAG: OmpA family protein [Nitrospirota bacterium]|nr:MAG: OmpA family protein [Nitrospirota bacterium]